MATTNLNPPADAPYFTPRHARNPGTPTAPSTATPTLFTPLTIRAVTLRNRIAVSPMCQYSAPPSGPEIGQLTDYHLATLGQYALKGAALVFVEATAVQPNGRISPNCPGLWDDAQAPALKRVVDFIHSQGAAAGIQLAHAGRKSSTTAPWVAAEYRRERGLGPGSVRATEEVGGWPGDVVGPMGGEGECFDGRKPEDEAGGFNVPRALSEAEIGEVVRDFGRAAARAVAAGVDVIEIHSAHGYLLHQFLSPVTNRRTDAYGGSFEGRTRLAREVVQEVRRSIPDGTPLFYRVSSTEWLEGSEVERATGGSWDLECSLRLARELPGLGVDLLDVSSGGNHRAQDTSLFREWDYQVSRAARIRREVRAAGKEMLIGAVGLIIHAEGARDIVQEGGVPGPDVNAGDQDESEARAARDMTDASGAEPMADLVLVARQFMREPEWVLNVARRLGVDVAWPSQFARAKLP